VANEFIAVLDKINTVVRADRTMRTALTTVLAIHKPRIFEQGFSAKGVKLGTYSTKPISIAKSEQARYTGKTFFKGGYAEYKRAIGKNNGFVNLRNTDQMYGDYGLIGSGQNFGFGFQNSENYRKSQYMEAKYQTPIFDLSRSEDEILADKIVIQIKNAI
jgi:hypothetical protein